MLDNSRRAADILRVAMWLGKEQEHPTPSSQCESAFWLAGPHRDNSPSPVASHGCRSEVSYIDYIPKEGRVIKTSVADDVLSDWSLGNQLTKDQ